MADHLGQIDINGRHTEIIFIEGRLMTSSAK
jgi:hypothetical protein